MTRGNRVIRFLNGIVPLWRDTGNPEPSVEPVSDSGQTTYHMKLLLLRQLMGDDSIQHLEVASDLSVDAPGRRIIDDVLSNLELVLKPDVIEKMTDLVLGMYDRTYCCIGERTYDLSSRSNTLFYRPSDPEGMFTLFDGDQPVEDPDQLIGSKYYNTLLVIGRGIPHFKTGDKGLYRAVILGSKSDITRFLCVKYYDVPGSADKHLVRRVCETNDISYARKHPNLGFDFS